MVSKALEFNVEFWCASLDLSKAFDTINHSFLFQALAVQNIPSSYIQLLQLLYKSQKGQVGSSYIFDIETGVKQGDVLSTLLFNA
eukprot:7053830-Karenia_brevis.AAC.1